MSNRTTALIIVAALLIIALGQFSHARGDEDDEEPPITSSAAQLSHDAAGRVLIALRPAAQKEIGITTKILQPVSRPVEIEAYGLVLDPAPLSKLNSELVSAQATLAAARAQYNRVSRLYTEQKNASQRDLQVAQASYLAGQSQLQMLQQQLQNDWGENLAHADLQSRSRLISALIERNAALARVTAPMGGRIDASPRTAEVVVLGHEEQPLKARAVYAAPTITPTFQGQPFLILIATTEFLVRPGAAVAARLPTSASQPGVMVPRSAVVRYAGHEWVYRELPGNRFVRNEIAPAETTQQGYFITGNLAPGTRVVAAGAQTLLSEELKAQIQVED